MDNTYGIALSDQVIEHVVKIWRLMVELAHVVYTRVLVVTLNASVWP